jgi:hypothetical protein
MKTYQRAADFLGLLFLGLVGYALVDLLGLGYMIQAQLIALIH